MSKSALLIIDMQEFFFQENTSVDRRQLAANCQIIAEVARARGTPVIHIWTVYRKDRSDWPESWAGHDDIWCDNLVRGSETSKIIPEIVIHPRDIILEKRRFSAFYNTNLDDVLRSLHVETIDVTGYSADVCVRYTSVDAYNRGYGVNIIREGVEAFRETTEASLHYLQWTIDAKVVSLQDYRAR